ncbi:MAG: glycosyltransferase [Candidatus Eisenbacteria bacterium]|nr:glycosyltransferase [Candidatus Eisenbacteria bacterium]
MQTASIPAPSTAGGRPRMAVATAVDLRQPFGHVVHLTEMFNALAEKGWEITLFVPQMDGAPPPHPLGRCGYQIAPVPVGRLPKLRMLHYESRVLQRIVRDHNRRPWDLIYTRSDVHSLAGRQAARMLNLPHVVEFNNLKGEEIRKAGRSLLLAHGIRMIEGFLAQGSQGVVTVTDGLSRVISGEYGASKERCAVIGNGVNTAHIKPAAEPPPPRPLRLVFIGQFTPFQGLPELVKAMTSVSDVARTTIVGSPPRNGELVHTATPGMEWKGRVPYRDLPAELQQAHAGVAPFSRTLNETTGRSPLKIFDYLACGLPVLSTRIPGLEFIEEEGVGRLVPPDDPAALVQAIRQMAADPLKLREMACRARRLAVDRFDWRHRARDLDSFLRKILSSQD